MSSLAALQAVVQAERRPLSESLPGMPITQLTRSLIENEIALIEREREARQDQTLQADELALLRAYLEKVDRVFLHGRNKAEWERLHPNDDRLDPGIPYPWSTLV